MRAEIIKASGKAVCRGKNCEKNPLYIAESGRIKTGSSCAALTIDSAKGEATAYYCRGCIDKVHDDVRKILNPKLWIFQ